MLQFYAAQFVLHQSVSPKRPEQQAYAAHTAVCGFNSMHVAQAHARSSFCKPSLHPIAVLSSICAGDRGIAAPAAAPPPQQLRQQSNLSVCGASGRVLQAQLHLMSTHSDTVARDWTPNRQSGLHPVGPAIRQCLLLGGAAFAASPALLLLDIAEQATLAMQRLQQRAATTWRLLQQDGDLQRQSTSTWQPEAGWRSKARPLLPLWPPALCMTLAVAPMLVLLVPQGRQACAPPLLLLAGSLLLQAYLNLQLVVLTRVQGSRAGTTAAVHVWGVPAGDTDSPVAQVRQPQPQLCHPSSPITQAPAAPAPAPPAAASARLLTCVQVAGDVFRCTCCCAATGLALQMLPAGPGASTSTLWLAIQNCIHAQGVSHTMASVILAADALQQLVEVWWSTACVALLCACGAAVHALSALGHSGI